MYIQIFTQASLYIGTAPMYSTNFGFKNICKNPFVLDVHRLVLLVIIPPVVQSHNCLHDEVSYVIQGWFKVYRKYCAVVYKSATSAPENGVRRKPGASILWILRDDCNDLTVGGTLVDWRQGDPQNHIVQQSSHERFVGVGMEVQRQSLCRGWRNGKEWGERALASEVGHFHFILLLLLLIKSIFKQSGMLVLALENRELCQVTTKIGLSCAEFEFEQFTKIEGHLSKDWV